MAIATHTHPHQWLNTDDALLATVIDVLDEHARQAERM